MSQRRVGARRRHGGSKQRTTNAPLVSGRPAALRTRSRRSLRSLAARSASARAALRLWSRSQSGSVRTNAARQASSWRSGSGVSGDEGVRARRSSSDAARRRVRGPAGGRAPSSSTAAGSAGSAAAACASRSHVSAAHSRLSVLPCAPGNARGRSAQARAWLLSCVDKTSDAPSQWATRRRPRRRRPASRRCGASGPSGCHMAGKERRGTPSLPFAALMHWHRHRLARS